jgi:hypothetical protein
MSQNPKPNSNMNVIEITTKCLEPTISETFPGIEFTFDPEMHPIISFLCFQMIGCCATLYSTGNITILKERSRTYRHDICNLVRLKHGWGEARFQRVENGKLVMFVDTNSIAKPLSQ